jgi:hypothetical protein
MNSKTFLSLSLAITSLALSASPIFANPLRSNNPLRPALAQAPEAEAPISENWADFAEVKDGFMQGCIGTETLAEEAATTKQNYCQCAFEAYSNRYSPQQFLQINTLANRAEEDGPTLVNLMMAPELNSCAEKTGFEF